jgi:3-oxoacyl-[acyl-carrier-protein] synthase III
VKIAAISYRVPSQKLTNSDLLDYMERSNPKVSPIKKAQYLKIVEKLLSQTGAKTRYLRNIDVGEKASDLIFSAIDNALEKANMTATDIDLLIYCGVGRGFLEPANAYFYAKAKGMHLANCFDVTDACMSWVRAAHIANLMLQSGASKAAMIVNGEFHLGLHDNWEIRDIRSLEYSFPMYTIGEAATATILLPSDRPWNFSYLSRPEFADLCTIPLPGYANFVEASDRMELNGINRFVSYGRDLFREGSKSLGKVIAEAIDDVNHPVWYFPHSPSKTVYEEYMPTFGVPLEKVYLKVYPEFGNVVSASIPVGLCRAEEEGVLQRGDPIAYVPVSAGLVASVVQLTY